MKQTLLTICLIFLALPSLGEKTYKAMSKKDIAKYHLSGFIQNKKQKRIEVSFEHFNEFIDEENIVLKNLECRITSDSSSKKIKILINDKDIFLVEVFEYIFSFERLISNWNTQEISIMKNKMILNRQSLKMKYQANEYQCNLVTTEELFKSDLEQIQKAKAKNKI